MKRFLSLCLLILLTSFFLNKTAIFATTAEEEDHGGDIYYNTPVKTVIFSHKAHSVDIGLECEWCHDETFEMEALAVEEEEDFTMESLCNENYCGTCHNGDISFSVTTQCARCHIGKRGYERLVKQGVIEPDEDDIETETAAEEKTVISKFDTAKALANKDMRQEKESIVSEDYLPEDITMAGKNTALFSHNTHSIRDKMKCTECHPGVFLMKVENRVVKKGQLTMKQMEKGEYCGKCHDGVKAFSISDKESCSECHPK